jgi:hypothetical protein
MNPTITLLVVTDGRRECLERTLATFNESTTAHHITHRVIVNDYPDNPIFSDWVDTLGFDTHIRPESQRRGYGGAISAGWAALPSSDFVFHLEDDFVFARYIDLHAMVDVMVENRLTQMALRRQPWNDIEIAAGGVIEQRAADYTDRTDGTHHWLEHRVNFTTNPSLYPWALTRRQWPTGTESEGHFSIALLEDPDIRLAYWGSRNEPPWVYHIGTLRIGTGY